MTKYFKNDIINSNNNILLNTKLRTIKIFYSLNKHV